MGVEGLKGICFTMDDGPSENWRDILVLLDSFNWNVTFFCLGEHLQKCLSFVQEAAARGHLLANHGWNHSRYPRDRRGEQVFWEGVLRTQALLEEQGGGTAVRPWFRFPYGDSGHGEGPLGVWSRKLSLAWHRGQAWLRDHGFEGPSSALQAGAKPIIMGCSRPYCGRLGDRDWLWTADLRDYLPNAAQQSLRRLQGQLARPGHHILLAHDQGGGHTQRLRSLLERMRGEGLL